MVVPRLAAAVLVALALTAGAASSSTASTGVPTGLRGFLLRADEPAKHAFPRTPAFAWNPVHAAKGYEFVLSTSSTFRENGVVWRCPSAKCPGLDTPVAAPGLSLPWITGSPHGLYARVRAVLTDGTKTGWSKAFGFDIVPPTPPMPLASKPGLLRWTPVAGATGYQVWLIDAKKFETVYTNVLDEREFYTFHQSPAWIGNVRWRVRALRSDSRSDERVNGVPVTQYGAWSPIYKSKNAAPAPGRIRLGSTTSDIVANGRRSDLAHRLMPGFAWSGNVTTDGTHAELYRVYVFTDKQCLNKVFTSSVVGSPSYAPRPYGGLNLPINATELVQARSAYISDVATRAIERFSLSYDGQKVSSSEAQAAAKPTTSLPVTDDKGGLSGTQSPPFLTLASGADLGAPVALWDDEWPNGGYYWTVVGVKLDFVGAVGTTLGAAAPAGSTTVVVASTPGFTPGDQVQIGAGADTEIVTIEQVTADALTFKAPGTLRSHNAGDPVVLLGGNVVYQDLELPQDVCAAGRVGRFGVSSEPSLIAGNDPFVSGLSPTGRLTSALQTSAFYRSPVISWTPALGASVYQVQWSKTARPFSPEAGPGDAQGVLTAGTSYVLPLTPGTWYYRVRGFDWSLPTGAQAMGWSDVAKLVVQNPTIKVVASAPVKKTKKK